MEKYQSINKPHLSDACRTKMFTGKFFDFKNLREVKFKKLDKVCDKVFIFIRSDEQQIPFDLVIHLQKMGKSVKWVVVDPNSHGELNYIITFMMGRLHQKIDKIIEFAIISNDPSFDSLIHFINGTGRSCLRVKQDNLHKERKSTPKVEEEVPTFDPFENNRAGSHTHLTLQTKA